MQAFVKPAAASMSQAEKAQLRASAKLKTVERKEDSDQRKALKFLST